MYIPIFCQLSRDEFHEASEEDVVDANSFTRKVFETAFRLSSVGRCNEFPFQDSSEFVSTASVLKNFSQLLKKEILDISEKLPVTSCSNFV